MHVLAPKVIVWCVDMRKRREPVKLFRDRNGFVERPRRRRVLANQCIMFEMTSERGSSSSSNRLLLPLQRTTLGLAYEYHSGEEHSLNSVDPRYSLDQHFPYFVSLSSSSPVVVLFHLRNSEAAAVVAPNERLGEYHSRDSSEMSEASILSAAFHPD